MDAAAIAAVQAQAMAAENRRRDLASQRPGHGTEMPLPQPLAGPGVGLSDNPLPVAGLGFSVAPGASEPQVAAYVMPNYAADAVGGFGFAAGRNEAPVRRHVSNLGADGLFIEGATAPARRAGSPVDVISPAAVPRRNLLGRLLGKFRR